MKDLVTYVLETKRISSINDYIKEAVDTYRLNNVEVTYIVEPEEIIIQAPETFQENDIQQYMDDRWLVQLPSNADYAKDLFGTNMDNIYDAHFEYDSFEHIDIEPRDYIEWDVKYDVKKTKDDIKLDYFRIKNLKYIISFDRFDMVGVDDDTVDEKLKDVFRAAESNDNNEWPIEIKFDEDALEYRK